MGEKGPLTRIAGRLDGAGPDGRSIATAGPALRFPDRVLDVFLGPFRPGTATLVDGNHPFVLEMVATLCVQAVGGLGGDVLYIDGGNSFDPYGMLLHARRLGADRDLVLDNIKVARAFTAYQMTSLLHDMLEAEMEARAASVDGEGDGHRPMTVVVGGIMELYLDQDVPRREARGMLDRCLGRLGDVTERWSTVTVAASYGLARSSSSSSASTVLSRQRLHGRFDRVVQVDRAGPTASLPSRRWHPFQGRPPRSSGRILLRVPSEDRAMVFYPTARCQRTLYDFGDIGIRGPQAPAPSGNGGKGGDVGEDVGGGWHG